ncbi:hypothetical protein BGZ63DRAFT_394387 [Mariannaea sp. PMI_226]|nr:hypothetical protein BGZ63DRAFT_394387 [Mariannaea sp. PMI_226]
MDLCITAEEPFRHHSTRSKPFSPVARSQVMPLIPPSPHRLHPRASSAASSYPVSPDTARATAVTALAPLQAQVQLFDQGPKFLEFELVVYDEASTNDNMLTHPWEVQTTPFRVPVDASKAKLLSLLRMHLPPSAPPTTTNTIVDDIGGGGIDGNNHSNSSNSSSSNFSACGTSSSHNAELSLAQCRSRTTIPVRRPKLIAATLYWTFRGDILPLGEDDEDWHYRNPITKTDLLSRSESEWFLLREMMAASNGALKSYLAIRGEAVHNATVSTAASAAATIPVTGPKKLGGYGWLFSSIRKAAEERRCE